MQQQYAITVPWNFKIRNASFDAVGLITLCQLLDGGLPTNANRFQLNCFLSVLSGPNQGYYFNQGTVAVPDWIAPDENSLIRISHVYSSAEVKQFFSNSPLLVSPPGLGKYIFPSYCFLRLNGVTVPYVAGNLNITEGTNNMFQFGNFLSSNQNVVKQYFPVNSAALSENTGLYLVATGSDPTNGDGELEVVIYYQVVSSQL